MILSLRESLAGLSRESGFKMIEHPPLSTYMTPVTTSFRFQSVWQALP